MGVKRIMETFFSGMHDQSMSGFGGRIVNTPMGPFRWNDTMQLWENVNNGMVMNNISFQDSMFMIDYSSTLGGGGGEDQISIFGCNYNLGTSLINSTITYTYENQEAETWYWVPSTNTSLTTNTCSATLYVNVDSITGTNPELLNNFVFKYREGSTFDDQTLTPSAAPYKGLTLGLTGSNVGITGGSRIGFAANTGVTTALAIALRYTDPAGLPGVCYGDVSFRVKVINQQTNQIIANTLVNFNNTDYNPELSGSFGNLLGVTTQSVTRWGSMSGPVVAITGATGVTFSDIRPFITLSVSTVRQSGTDPNLDSILYSKNNRTPVVALGGFTIGAGEMLKIGAIFPDDISGGLGQGITGNIFVYNQSNGGATLASITWSYNYAPIFE